jgi:hypothetical protein
MLDADPHTNPEDSADHHHASCQACSALYAFARARADHVLLEAWRRQLAEHLSNELLREGESPATAA